MDKLSKVFKTHACILAGTTLALTTAPAAALNLIDIGTFSGSYGDINTHATAVYAWDGHNNAATTPSTALAWSSQSYWYTFTLADATALDIAVTRNTVNPNPNWHGAFTLWATSGFNDPDNIASDGGFRGYDQAGTGTTLSADSYAVVNGLDCSSAGGGNPCQAGDTIGQTTDLYTPGLGGVTSFIGYANSGNTGWHNGVGHLIGTGAGGTVTVDFNNGSADLVTGLLPAGQYVLAVGGSYACNTGVSFVTDATSACPTTPILAGTSNTYNLTINAVPIPAAVWLMGSALAGLGVTGRRKGKTTA